MAAPAEAGKKMKYFIGKKGFSLILALFIILLLSGIVAALSSIFVTDIKIVDNHSRQLKALYIADAGVEYAISRLVQNRAWRANNLSIEFPSGSGNHYVINFRNLPTLSSQCRLSDGLTKTIQAEVQISGNRRPYVVKLTNWREL